MRLVNIGFGSTVNADRIVAVLSPDSAPIRRRIQEAKESHMLVDALCEALMQLNAMREREGENLKKDFMAKLDELEALVAQIQQRAPMVVQEYKEKLYTRIQEHLDKNKVPEFDEGRLEVEITMFADRCCIDEELTRLGSHIRQYRQTLEKNEPIGRQLDFLTQELNRETNTIASKSNDLTITMNALAMKNVIE